MTTARLARELSPEGWAACEGAVARFAAAWRADAPPDPAGFLPPAGPGTLRLAVLVEVIHTDLELRTKAGLPVAVRDYFARFPEISGVPDLADELVAAHVDLLFRCRPPAPPLSAVGPYELLTEVGRGGSAVVYRGRDMRDGRVVAVKVLRPWVADDPVAARRFAQEVAVAARLAHPGIAAAVEFGRDAGACYLASEFVDGQTLAAWARSAPRSPREIADVIAVVADAVAYAHDRGVLHRDLSATNVLVTADGRAKVVDFGLARATRGGTPATRSAGWVGTPAYLAPEVLAGRPPDARSEVYALGVLLFEALTGRVPVPNPLSARLWHADRHPRQSSRFGPAVPHDLDLVCRQALAPRPSARYATPAALAADLRRFLAGGRVAARPARPFRIRAAAMLVAAGVVTFAGWRESAGRQAGLPDPAVATEAPNQGPGTAPPADTVYDPVAAHMIRLISHRDLQDDVRLPVRLDILTRAVAAYRDMADRDPVALYPRAQLARTATERAELLAECRRATPDAVAAEAESLAAWNALLAARPDNLVVRAGHVVAHTRVVMWGRSDGHRVEGAVGSRRALDLCRAVIAAWDGPGDPPAVAAAELGTASPPAWWEGPSSRRVLRYQLEHAAAELASEVGHADECVARVQACCDLADSIYHHPSSRFKGRTAALVIASRALAEAGRPGDALSLWAQRLGARDEDVGGWQAHAKMRYSEALFLQAQLLEDVGDPASGADTCRAAVRWARRAVDEDNSPAYVRWEGVCLHQLGNVLEEVGGAAEAATAFAAAVDIRRHLVDGDPGRSQYQLDLSASLYDLAQQHEVAGNVGRATVLYRQAAEVHSSACAGLPPGHVAHRWMADRMAALQRVRATPGHKR